MTHRELKFFGGPWHGRREVVAQGTRNIIVAIAATFQPMRYVPDELTPPADRRTCTYFIQAFGEYAIRPYRVKTIEAAILEGVELAIEEHLELKRDLARLPWIVPSGDFLTNYDQWFAERAYHYFGKLWWRDAEALTW